MKYIDIHCHPNLPEFAADQDAAITRALDAEVGMIMIGVDFATSDQAIRLAEKYQNTWATIGLHPADNLAEVFDYNAYKKLAEHPKVVGIGECGLDYFHGRSEDIERQKDIFIQQIQIANEVGKPLMLHIRNGKKGEDAYGDALEIIKKYARVKGNVHFFAGSLDIAKRFIDLGFTLSFTGVITFTHDYDEVIKNIPLDMIMSETDAPYVAPVPYRGKRNEPLYVIEVVKKIAEIRGESLDKVAMQLLTNTQGLFSIE